MNEALIMNWNARVKDDDVVYHNGDFCLAPNTYIDTPSGRKQIRNIKKGDKVYSISLGWEKDKYKSKLLEVSTVTNVLSSYSDYRLRIKLENNTTIESNGNHPFAVSKKNGIIYWIKADSLKKNDVLFHRKDIPAPIVEKWYKEYKLGYIWGYVKGDGCDRDGFIDIQSKDYDGLSRIKTFIKELFDIEIVIKSQKYYRLKIPKSIVLALRKFDLTYSRITIHNQEWNRGFIAGFYDAEGSLRFQSNNWYITLCNTNRSLINVIKKKLRFFGFKYLFSKQQPKGFKLAFILKLFTKNTCEFCLLFRPAIKRKYPDLAILANGVRIKSIEKVYNKRGDLFKNYNLTVEPNNNYFAKGILVHNCFKNSSGGKAGEGMQHKSTYWTSKLNGKIIFVAGNHDKNNSTKTIIHKIVIKYGHHYINMVHDPKYYDDRYAINFIAHVHNHWKFKRIINPYDDKFTDLINIGVDQWAFRPVSFEEIYSAYRFWTKHLKKEDVSYST